LEENQLLLPDMSATLHSAKSLLINRSYMQAFGLPNAKVGQPEDIASAVSYLVSPGAHFITGEAHELVAQRMFTDNYY
jgi:NAD(P)-dependent dehydrogenase (short-subunit alcohol dehydrogenase family)